MKKWEIILWGDPRLEAANAPVRNFDQDLHQLTEEMFSTCHRAPGLGLAAPQIGLNIRLTVLDLSVGRDPAQKMVLANPKIIEESGSTTLEEGCLSFPGLFTHIQRPKKVVVSAQGVDGREILVEGEELLAQALCHEIDHLESILLIHHLKGLKRRMFLKKVEKLRKAGQWKR